MEKAAVLSSGGLDSSTCVGLAVEKYGAENVIAVSAFYGQKHDKELECARKVADYYGIRNIETDLSAVMQYSDCSLLTGSTKEIQHGSYEEQLQRDGAVETYVPFRNGLILSAVSAIALSINPDDVTHLYIGVHADDAAGDAYADCRPDFIEHMGEAIRIGTYGKVILEAPFVNVSKGAVVKEGLRLGVPYELTWSCYEGGDVACGKCGTCIDRLKAFAENGVDDPIEYAPGTERRPQ